MASLFTPASGLIVVQHFALGQAGGTSSGGRGASWPMNHRDMARKVRIRGQSPTSDYLVCDGVKVQTEPSSVGDGFTAEAVWYASGQPDPNGMVRTMAFWAGAVPGVMSTSPPPADPTGKTGERPGSDMPLGGKFGPDPYQSNVQGPKALPAFWQAKDGSWAADTGVVAQKVALGGDPIPGGAQVLLVPFTVRTEQQMAAFAVGNRLVAVWAGGAPNGKYGSVVYDVTTSPTGDLDQVRKARLQSSFRIYRLPVGGGGPVPLGTTGARSSPSLLPFGGPVPIAGPVVDPLMPGAPPPLGAGGAPPVPTLLPGGIAWQQGLDIDGQAGYGAIVDLVRPVIAPPPKPGTPKDTTTKTVTPSSAATSIQGSGTVTAPGSTPVVTVSGTTISITAANQITPTTTKDPPPPPPTYGPAVQVIGLCGKQAYGLHSVGQPVDKHRISVTPDGEPINCTHPNVLAPVDGDGFDAPYKTDPHPWVDVSQGGSLWLEVLSRYDKGSSHPFIDGPREGLRRYQVQVPFDTKQTVDTTKGPGQDKVPSDDKLDPATGKDVSTLADDEIVYPPPPPVSVRKNPYSTYAFEAGSPKPPFSVFGKDTASDQTGRPVQPPAGGVSPQPDVPNPMGNPPPQGPLPQPPPLPPPQAPTGPPNMTGGGGPGVTVEKYINDTAHEPGYPGGYKPAGIQVPSTVTFGTMVLLAPGYNSSVSNPVDLAGPQTVRYGRGYTRGPNELRVPAIIAYPVPIFSSSPDLRGRTNALTPSQLAYYNSSIPVPGVIAGVGDQSSGAFTFSQSALPGNSLYPDGACAGGFGLTPGNVDVATVQAGKPLPKVMPRTSFFFCTTATQLAMADPGQNGQPVNGFATIRDDVKTLSTRYYPASGTPDPTIGMQLVRSALNTFVLYVGGVAVTPGGGWPGWTFTPQAAAGFTAAINGFELCLAAVNNSTMAVGSGALPGQNQVTYKNLSGGNHVITAQGAETFQGGGATYTVPANKTQEFISDGQTPCTWWLGPCC